MYARTFGVGGSEVGVAKVVVVTLAVATVVGGYPATLRFWKTVILPILLVLIVKFESLVERTKFSSRSREVIRSQFLVQYFEIIESPKPGTYQTLVSL